MSEEDDWDFADEADAMFTIRAAARYLLRRSAGSDRGDIVSQIIETVRQAAFAEQATRPDPFDDEALGG
jgi:hypothetical protein